jgi:hypothetical protein
MRRKLLGGYLVAVAVTQLLIYVAVTWFGDHLGWLMYFDPRFGVYVLEDIARHAAGGVTGPYPALLSWLSALPLLASGVAVLRNQRHLRTYRLVEIALAAPTIVFIVIVLVANVSASDGFSLRELFVGPIWVFFAVSVFPFSVASQLLSEAPRRETA